ncbi:MAG: PEP-CTERM sorting domain-containing protein [Planctomycetota bacterium]
MSRNKTRLCLLMSFITFHLTTSTCQAGLIVSLDGLELDNENSSRIRVLAEHDGLGEIPTITSFAIRLEIEAAAASFGGLLKILDDNESERTRSLDPDHIFSGTTPILFDASVFNGGRTIEIIDSVGLLDLPASLSSPRVIAAFNVVQDPLRPLVGNEEFRISVDETETTFFDGGFATFSSTQTNFRSGLLRAASIPEPSPISLLFMGLASTLGRRKERQTRDQPRTINRQHR